MRLKEMLVGDLLGLREVREYFVQPSHKRGMLDPFDNIEICFSL
jgi:hypothetical protein